MTDEFWQETAERAYPRVYRALVAMGASRADAADALQDAFERALRQTSSIDQPEAWLFVVALRRWRTLRLRARLLVPLDLLRRQPVTPAPSENAVLLISELRRLPQREREVVVCRYVIGMSQQETAAALGIAVGTVVATTVHATRKLRERLDARDARSRSEATTIH